MMVDYIDILKSETNKVYIIKLEKSLYSKSTLLKSCYKFTDVAYIYIQTEKKDNIEYFKIFFTIKDDNSFRKEEFLNELLDQELRTIILKDTNKIRTSIVSRALLSGQQNEY